MKKIVAMVVPVLLLFFGPVEAQELRERAVEPLMEDGGGTTPTKERACDCCQKCMAAMKKVDPKPALPEKKTAKKDGCRECCDRCGKEKKPSEETFPPEVMPH